MSVDRDQFIDICVQNDILGIPSFLIFKEGQLLGSYIGKEKNQLIKLINFISTHLIISQKMTQQIYINL